MWTTQILHTYTHTETAGLSANTLSSPRETSLEEYRRDLDTRLLGSFQREDEDRKRCVAFRATATLI